MNTISVCKAQQVVRPIEDTTIILTQTLPEFGSAEEQAMFCKTDAQVLATALFRTLPGATVDQLLILMLEYTAGSLRISKQR